MTSEWDQLANAFAAGQTSEAVTAARQRLQQPKDSDWQWLIDLLLIRIHHD